MSEKRASQLLPIDLEHVIFQQITVWAIILSQVDRSESKSSRTSKTSI